MTKRQFVYTDLQQADSLFLSISGVPYEVIEFTSSWALNEVPTAMCVLALGRNVRTLIAAKVHTENQHFQMETATVWFKPTQEYSPNQNWPDQIQPTAIFFGYFTGFSYRKINNKVYAIANLQHWLTALGMSSTLTANGHASNPSSLNSPAVLQALNSTLAGGKYLSNHVPFPVAANITADLWGAIKDLFCFLAGLKIIPTTLFETCGGGGTRDNNSFAMAALNRIEGGLSKCITPRVWSVPLKMGVQGADPVPDYIPNAIVNDLGVETIESWSSATFWDKLVGHFCPSFGMSVVPMVLSAIVIADTPALSADPVRAVLLDVPFDEIIPFWREIDVDEYDSFDMSSELFRPFRGVGILGSYDTELGAGTKQFGDFTPIGGCWVEDSVSPADGMLQFIQAPKWLSGIKFLPKDNIGLALGVASPTATNGIQVKNKFVDYLPANKFFKAYAHDYYVNMMLRGRVGTLSGKLRFDIAPGSNIKINPSMDVFIGGEDTLAFPIYANVIRVSITINAEAEIAETKFLLSHMRTEPEMSLTRTSVTQHPLFGDSIHGGGLHGSPLVDAFNLPDPTGI